jgi:hypothetical protein
MNLKNLYNFSLNSFLRAPRMSFNLISTLKPTDAIQELMKIACSNSEFKQVRRYALSEIARLSKQLHEAMTYNGERAMKEPSPMHMQFLVDSIVQGTSNDMAGDLVELEACAAYVIMSVFE